MRVKQTIITISLLFTFLWLNIGLTAMADEKKLDINQATVEQFSAIPGLNEDLAKSIIEARAESGEFVDMEELLDIDGIDNKLLRRLKKYLFIGEVDGCNC